MRVEDLNNLEKSKTEENIACFMEVYLEFLEQLLQTLVTSGQMYEIHRIERNLVDSFALLLEFHIVRRLDRDMGISRNPILDKIEETEKLLDRQVILDARISSKCLEYLMYLRRFYPQPCQEDPVHSPWFSGQIEIFVKHREEGEMG